MANHLEELARAKARKYGLGPWFVRQIGQESGFRAGARSPVGAQGVAQIMPATAKAWGVNPNDPAQALDAAAKHMAAYVRQFGSVEKALRAYNAGPGNVEKSKGFAETNAYVQRILNGHTPAVPSSSSSGSESSRLIPGKDKIGVTTSFDQAGFDQATRRSQVGSFMAERRGPNDMLAKLLGTTAPDRTDFESTGVSFKQGADRIAPSGAGKPGKKLHTLEELFYDPGTSIDSGHKVAPIGGHSDHVHVAVDSDRDRDMLLRLARRKGVTVTSEGTGQHVAGSFHYQKTKGGKSKAIDFGGDPSAMMAFDKAVARRMKRR